MIPARKLRIGTMAAVTVGCTAAISFSSLRNLAVVAGFQDWQSWCFPLCLDAVFAVALELWLRHAQGWQAARRLAFAALCLSLVGNVLDWWLRSGTVLAAVLGAVPPAMLGSLLLVLHRTAVPARRSRDRSRVVPADPQAGTTPVPVVSAPDTAPVPATAGPVPARRMVVPAVSDETIIAELLVSLERGESVTKRAVMAGHGVGSTRALRLLQAAQERHTHVVSIAGGGR